MNRSDVIVSERTGFQTPREYGAGAEIELPFSLVIAHDTAAAAAKAGDRIVGLLGGCIPNLDIHRDQWSFYELDHPEFRREALELAARCDIFVIATVDREGLPESVRSWLEQWVKTRERKESALVCLVGSRQGKLLGTPVQTELQALAAAHDLAFFASGFVQQESFTNPESKPARGPIHTGYAPRPEAWGINE